MTAWEVLTTNSTITTGTAWQHLNAQGGGSGGDVYVYGELIASIEPEFMVVLEGDVLATIECDFGATIEHEEIAEELNNITVEVSQ